MKGFYPIFVLRLKYRNMEKRKFIKDKYPLEMVMGHLIGEHMYLKAQIEVQKAYITILLSSLDSDHKDSVKKIIDGYPELVRQKFDNLVSEHYMLEDAWKKYLKDELLDIPGISLPD